MLGIEMESGYVNCFFLLSHQLSLSLSLSLVTYVLTSFFGIGGVVKITLSTHVEKHSPIYHLNIKTSAKQADQKPPPPIIDVTSPFTAWFDENGYLVPAPLKAFLDNSIPELKSTKLDAAGGGGKQEQKHQQKQKQGVVKRERD